MTYNNLLIEADEASPPSRVAWIEMTYDDLLIEADEAGLVVKELPLQSSDGRCRGKRIAIRKDIPTLRRKADVLAEEIGHYYTSVGNILNLNDTNSRKQEQKARLWAYNKRIGLLGLVRAYQHGCLSRSESAEYLNVSEELLAEAVECYRSKYGLCAEIDNYIIFFELYLTVMERL